MNSDRAENALLVSPGLLLLALAFFLPIARMLMLSVMGPEGFTLSHFAEFIREPYYLNVLWRTIRLSFIITLISALVGFPLAYIMARAGPRLRITRGRLLGRGGRLSRTDRPHFLRRISPFGHDPLRTDARQPPQPSHHRRDADFGTPSAHHAIAP